jgi:undecaprenyl-diphosphatase
MTAMQAVLLGMLQGLTEFLPVSSSGHLAMVQGLMPGFRQPGVVFDVALHVGTVAAVVALEWKRVLEAIREGYVRRLTAQLAVATLATIVIALPLRHRAETAFTRPLAVAAGFAATGLILLVARGLTGGRGAGETGWGATVFVGLVQGAAVMPGISRSGSTIVGGMTAGMERRWAADFSFILSVPAVLGAAVLEAWSYRAELAADGAGLLPLAGLGAASAAVVGAFALLAVRRLVHEGRLHVFAYYVLPMSFAVLLLWATGVWR